MMEITSFIRFSAQSWGLRRSTTVEIPTPGAGASLKLRHHWWTRKATHSLRRSILESLDGEALHPLRGFHGFDLDHLPEHRPRAGCCSGLVLDLEHRQTRDGKLPSLLALSNSDVTKGGQDALHILRLQPGFLGNRNGDGPCRHRCHCLVLHDLHRLHCLSHAYQVEQGWRVEESYL